MSWLDESGPERRPVVFVEDHLYHTTDLLSAVRVVSPVLLAHCTVAVLDRPGPDTDAAVRACRDAFPEVQVELPAPADRSDAASFCRWTGRRIRPGGMLIQDVQLSTLPFIPPDRWWESIYVAATIRGMFPNQPPVVRFLSNKRGYNATFGRDMLDAGFDPRDVMEKSDLSGTIVPSIAALFDRAFPLALSWGRSRVGAGSETGRSRVGVGSEKCLTPADRPEIDRALDLVLWHSTHGTELSGRALADPAGRVSFRSGSPEADTWSALIDGHLGGSDGLPVLTLGARIGPPQAERAELTNLAARHIHTLRSRLRDTGDLVTVRHAYRLNDHLRVGIVQPRTTFATARAVPKVSE